MHKCFCILEQIDGNMNMSEEMKKSLICFVVIKGVKCPYTDLTKVFVPHKLHLL